jgi:hypothetical protein
MGNLKKKSPAFARKELYSSRGPAVNVPGITFKHKSKHTRYINMTSGSSRGKSSLSDFHSL